MQIIFVCLYNVGTVAKTCNLPNMKNFTIHLFKNKIIKIKAALKTLVQVQQKYLSSLHCLLLFSFDHFYDPPVQDYPNQSHLELFFTPTIHHSNKSIFSVAIVCCPFPLTTHTIIWGRYVFKIYPYNLSFLQKFLFQLPLFVALSFDHSYDLPVQDLTPTIYYSYKSFFLSCHCLLPFPLTTLLQPVAPSRRSWLDIVMREEITF